MFVFLYHGHGLKIGYDDLHNFCVFDEKEKYSNLFNLALVSNCLLSMITTLVDESFCPTVRIVHKTLTDAQREWLSKYIETVREAERENDRLDA